MNIKLILASGVMAALIGTMIGYGIGRIKLLRGTSQINSYYSQYYKNLYSRNYLWIGAGAGLAIGMGQECVRQMKQQNDKES
ncbi:MAG: hypothetical protein VKJ02_18005 [Snowella sp.]|nr:hypothetical protein [Snowella sp.]